VRPVAVSADSPQESAALCKNADYSFTFLSDPKAEVVRRYDLLHSGAGLDGRDIARPAQFLLDSSDVVRWIRLTEDFRMWTPPEDYLKAVLLLH